MVMANMLTREMVDDSKALIAREKDAAAGFSAVMVAAKEVYANVFHFLIFAGANPELRSKAGETATMLSQSHNNPYLLEQVTLKFYLEKGNGGYYSLHCAA